MKWFGWFRSTPEQIEAEEKRWQEICNSYRQNIINEKSRYDRYNTLSLQQHLTESEMVQLETLRKEFYPQVTKSIHHSFVSDY